MPPIKRGSRLHFWVITALLALFSVFYFADTCLRAAEKSFWFDELCTLYICRLPTMHAVWQAVLHGVDYNPPLFYVFTRAANKLFGEGLIATRMPAIIGVWVLCLCLFRFVYRRAGLLPAGIALLFPLLTSAYFYAYEARPHGIVLGFCGLSLITWQMWDEEPRRIGWLTAFAVALACAFFTHCYAVLLAVPFALAELAHTIQRRRVRWGFWVALAIPGVAAGLLFLPLLRSYKTVTAGTLFADMFRAGFHQLPAFYSMLLSPAILVLVLTLIVFAGCRQGFGGVIKRSELTLLLGLIAIPIFGILLGKVVKGPFIPRYFMSAVAGFALLLAFGAAWPKNRNIAAILLALVMTFGVTESFAKLIWHSKHGVGEVLEEPSSKTSMDTTPGRPLDAYSVLTAVDTSPLPVAVVDPPQFLYLVHYDPQLARHLYYASSSKDELFYRLYKAMREFCPLHYDRELTFDELLSQAKHFYVTGETGYLFELRTLMERGGKVQSLRFGGAQFLAEIQMDQGEIR
jgi:hypothetical protein